MKRFIEKEDFYTLGKASSEYQPAWDYEPDVSPSLLSMESYEAAFPQAEELSRRLNITPIALYFIEDDDLEGHLARYINGTSSSPVIVLTDRVQDIDEAHLTLFHELGHAYIDSVGGEVESDEEEDLVETFAHIAYMKGLDPAVDFLKRKVGEEELEENPPNGVLMKGFIEVKKDFPGADFWVQRTGKKAGNPSKSYSPHTLGVKVLRTDILDPDYLYYWYINLFNQGFFKSRIVGGIIPFLRKKDIEDALKPLLAPRANPPTDILYHKTRLDLAADILEDNKFLTSVAFGTPADKQINRNKLYYLSTTRSPVGDYGPSLPAVTFKLDGRKLGERSKAAAVHYWGPGWSKDEMEDRVFTDEPWIEPASKFILEVHAGMRVKGQTYRPERIEELEKLVELSEDMGIPIYLYPDLKSYAILNRSKRITLDQWMELFEEQGDDLDERWSYPSEPWSDDRLEEPAEFIKAIEAGNFDDIDKGRKSFWYTLKYDYGGEYERQLSNAIHNNKSDPKAREAISIIGRKMNQLGTDSLQGLIDWMQGHLKAWVKENELEEMRPLKSNPPKDGDYKTYREDYGHITVMENSPWARGAHSVFEFFVKENKRGQGLGKRLLRVVIDAYPNEEISAQVSSVASLKVFMDLGFRVTENPDASFSEAKDLFHYNLDSLNVRLNDPEMRPLKSNPFSARITPDKFSGPASGLAHVRRGFHTATEKERSVPYANQKASVLFSHAKDYMGFNKGEPIFEAIEDYPVILSLDMGNLPYSPDIDDERAMGGLSDQIRYSLEDLSPEELRSSEAIEDAFQSWLDNSESPEMLANIRSGSEVSGYLFYITGYPEVDPLRHFIDFISIMDEEEIVSIVHEILEGEISPSLVADIFGQRRYEEDVSDRRLVEVYFMKPFWPWVLDDYNTPEEVFETLGDVGFDALGLEDVYSFSLTPSFTKVWDRSKIPLKEEQQLVFDGFLKPHLSPTQIQYHGTSYKNLISAAPWIKNMLPSPPSPFGMSKEEAEELYERSRRDGLSGRVW